MEMIYIAVAVIVLVAAILIYKRREKGAEEVPQGLQVFDESGNTIVDTSERLTKYLGTFTVPTDAVSGEIINPEIGDGELWYTIKIEEVSGYHPYQDGVVTSYPKITKGDGKILWSYPSSAARFGAVVHYGVY